MPLSDKLKQHNYPYQNRNLEDMPGEEWRPIPGYGNFFYISNLGRVKSFFHSASGKIKAQRLYTKGEGLLSFKIAFEGKEYEFRTAAVVYQVFVGELDFKIYNIAYKDGNNLNLHLSNLEPFKRYNQVEKEKREYKKWRIEATASMYKYPYQNLSLVDIEGEIWNPFLELPDYYAVSNKGRVKSLERMCKARSGGICIKEAQIMKQRVQYYENPHIKETFQHLSVCTHVDYKKREFTVARLVYEAFIAPVDWESTKHIVRHKDGDSFKNAPENLYLSDYSGLLHDLIQTGRKKRKSGRSDRNCWTDQEWEAGYDNMRVEVSQFDLQGNYIRTYKGISLAAKTVGINLPGSISGVIKGRSRTIGGFQWRLGADQTPMKALNSKRHSTKAYQAKKVGKYDLNGRLLEVYPSGEAAIQSNDVTPRQLYNWLKNPEIVPRKGRKHLWRAFKLDEEVPQQIEPIGD